MSEKKPKGIVISETHWDRAWYLTFQQFRLKLVKLTDKLLNILENDPAFTHYTFDGQTVVLEDYLEVKPENEERIRKLVKNSRIHIGPWYVLPDEFLVSGEALIRNLLIGRGIAELFGECMDVGYIPDPFGHVSQIPQILNQFNYDSVIFARGMGEEAEELGSEFIWKASDGSSIFAHWLPQSYGNIASLPEDVDDAVSVIEEMIGKLEPWSKTDVLLLMNGSDHLEPQKHIPKVVETYNEQHERYIKIGTLQEFVEYIRTMKGELKEYSGEFREPRFQNLLSGVYSARIYLKQANEYSQRYLERMVEPWCTAALALGAAYPAHELRMAWKYLIKNHPHDDICGCSIDQVHDDMMQRFRWVDEIADALLDEALDSVLSELQNSKPSIVVSNATPHTRSGIAEIELAVSNIRFTRLGQIRLKDPDYKADNPLDAARNEAHVAYIRTHGFDLPPNATREIKMNGETLTEFEFDFTGLAMLFPELKDSLRHLSTVYRIRVNSNNRVVEVFARKYDASDKMRGVPVLFDSEGNQIPTQVLGFSVMKDEKSHLIADQEEFIRLAISAQDVPALGMKRYNVDLREQSDDDVNPEDVVNCTEEILENEFVMLRLQEDSRISLTDKRNGEVYNNLLEFEDTADVGDEYDYSPAHIPVDIRSAGQEVALEVIHEGPIIGSWLLSGALELPIAATTDDLTREQMTEICDYVMEVTLMSGSPTVYVTILFDNRALDHRLRVLCPTGTKTETCKADSTFDIIERPVRPKPHDDWVQPVVPTYPLRSFVTVQDEKRGLMLTTEGLLEFEILKEQGNTIALTLLRAVGWLSKIGLKTRRDAAGPVLETPGAQCLGTNIAEFAITPLVGDSTLEDTLNHSENYLIPLDGHFLPASDTKEGVSEIGLIEIIPSLIQLSAFKQSEDEKCIILRFWNSSQETQKCKVKLGFSVNKVTSSRMDEEETDWYSIKKVGGNEFEFDITGRHVATLRLYK